MRSEQLIGINCVAFEVSNRTASSENLEILVYSGHNYDVGISQGNGRFRLVKENDLVKEVLDKGKGVYLDGSVFFAEQAVATSTFYLKFKKHYDQKNAKVEKKCTTTAEAFLLEHVSERHVIPIINSILDLFDCKFFTTDLTLKKLIAYMPEERVAELMSIRYDGDEQTHKAVA